MRGRKCRGTTRIRGYTPFPKRCSASCVRKYSCTSGQLLSHRYSTSLLPRESLVIQKHGATEDYTDLPHCLGNLEVLPCGSYSGEDVIVKHRRSFLRSFVRGVPSTQANAFGWETKFTRRETDRLNVVFGKERTHVDTSGLEERSSRR